MSSPPSRIAAARARVAAAKNWLMAAAIALFAATMVAVRNAGDPQAKQANSSSSSASTGGAYEYQQDDGGYFDQGTFAPSQSAPQASTGSS
jgi:hypothetical protein